MVVAGIPGGSGARLPPVVHTTVAAGAAATMGGWNGYHGGGYYRRDITVEGVHIRTAGVAAIGYLAGAGADGAGIEPALAGGYGLVHTGLRIRIRHRSHVTRRMLGLHPCYPYSYPYQTMRR